MEFNDDNLLKLYAAGVSYTDAGKQMGVTRGVVCRRISRLLKNDPSLERRKQGVNPLGKTRVYPAPSIRTKPRGTGKYVPTQTVGSSRGRQMTKSEMYEDLRKAVENTK